MSKKYYSKTKKELIDELINKDQKIEDLEEEIKNLKWQLNTNTSNSSKPSSTEWFKKLAKICNSRKKSKKLRWWQQGHKWNNLKRIENIDEKIDLTPKECQNCWANLFKQVAKIIKKVTKQTIDIVPPNIVIKDYFANIIKCDECGFINKPVFPKWVNKAVQYWPEIKTFMTYL